MRPRRLITFAVVVLAVTGAILVSIPFTQSMRPTERAVNALPRVKISAINPGEFSLIPYTPRRVEFNDWVLQVFVYRKHDGTYNVWKVPTRNDSVGLPDLHWWRPMLECKNFGPTTVNGVVDETKPIKCHDKNSSEIWGTDWQWTIDGKNMGKMVEDMDMVSGAVEGEFYVFKERS